MSTGALDPTPRLIADIGGTNARFALQTPQGLENIRVLACTDYPTLVDALTSYLAAASNPAVRHVAIGIANPVYGDQIRMTNHSWAFSTEETRRLLGLDTFLVLNDFAVLARALPVLPTKELTQIGGTTAVPGAPLGLLGAGTGLGVSGLIPTSEGGWVPLAGEGGHVSFAPFDEREVGIWRIAQEQFGGHVSAERLLNGAGMVFLHGALARLNGVDAAPRSAAEITRLALAGEDALCSETVSTFCTLLGTVAADLAITLGARGGVYIGGGIVPRLGAAFAQSPFRARFENKGRTSAYLRDIPVWVIHSPWPALHGAAAALEQHLQQTNGRHGTA